MRKIIATEFYSLDGLMSDPKDEMDWVSAAADSEVGRYEDELYKGADCLLLGRVTYQIFESYWPHAGGEDLDMAGMINSMTKVVFSTTLRDVSWNNSEIRNKIDPAEIREMKSAEGKDMIIVGSAKIVQQFSEHGLIDEYHLMLNPVVLGQGKRLFEGSEKRLNLKLTEAKAYANGVVGLFYHI